MGCQRLMGNESRESPSWMRGDTQIETCPWAGALGGLASGLGRARLGAVATGGMCVAPGTVSTPQGLGLLSVYSWLARCLEPDLARGRF